MELCRKSSKALSEHWPSEPCSEEEGRAGKKDSLHSAIVVASGVLVRGNSQQQHSATRSKPAANLGLFSADVDVDTDSCIAGNGARDPQ